ncbi:hypothetical protein R1sor_015290 [Riccia sorocarpa]|uniref:RING-type domain-containing protein n=1 Tax=Riccia sorocarpa TaxID=122646 RepID=A0ABD3HDN3_9MARC
MISWLLGCRHLRYLPSGILNLLQGPSQLRQCGAARRRRRGRLPARRGRRLSQKTKWEKWRKQAQPPYLPPKAEVRKSFLHYASLELHGVKVDWTTVDLSQATNTVSYETKMAACRELFRMRVRMDGRLVETMDPDEMEKSQKGNRLRKRKRRLASEKADGVPSTDNSLPQETPPICVNPSAPANTSGVATEVTGGMIAAMKPVLERIQKGKQKVSEAPAELEHLRMLKTALNLSRADQYKEPSIGTPIGQTSGRGSNQPVPSENPVDDRICSIGLMEESASNLATHTMSHFTLVLEEHKCVRRHQADLEERLAEIEKENLALNNKAQMLEAEKQLMTDRVALMSRPDLYELLEAKLDGFQLANHAGVVRNFENLTLTLTRKWTAIPGLNLDRFEQCPDEYPDFASYAEKWNGWKEHYSLCTSSLGFLPSINTGVCQHNFHFTCFWKYVSTRRLCPICRTALPDATYEFFCTIFVLQGSMTCDLTRGVQWPLEVRSGTRVRRALHKPYKRGMQASRHHIPLCSSSISSHLDSVSSREEGMASESGNKGLSGKKRNTPEDLLEHATHFELENRWLEARLKTSEEEGRKNRLKIDDLRREQHECKEELEKE